MFAIALGVGAATLAAWLLAAWLAWLLASFGGTVACVAAVRLELALAEDAEERHH